MLKKLAKSCTLAGHLNGRTEKHGEEHVPAFDLRLTVMLTKKQLDDMTGHTARWHSWYLESKEDGTKPIEHWHPYRWKPKVENCKASITVGDSTGKEEIDIGACKIRGFSFIPHAGGQTECSFTLQAHVTEENCRILLWMGCDDASCDIVFGDLVVAQQDLKLDQDEEETEITDEAPTPRTVSRDDERPTVN